MSWFTVNGIELARVAAAVSPPTGTRRDIGAQSEAADGSTLLTRQVTKRDLRLATVPLGGDDALAWEGLLTGDGHVWSFDVSAYSSKGFPPTTNDGTLVSTSPSPKYGAKYLRLVTDAEETFALGYDKWTVAYWHYDTAWDHVVIRSDGKIWLNGARNDSFTPPAFSSFTSGLLRFVGEDPGPSNIDDLVVTPYLWPLDWPPQVFRAGVAFGGTPYLSCAGDLVREAATRRMICKAATQKVVQANRGEGLERDLRTLEFDLLGA